MVPTKSHARLYGHENVFGSLETKVAKPGGCGDRTITFVVQVKDSYGATSVCGGTSHPEGIYACPTANVDPFAGSKEDLLADLEVATTSVSRNRNFFSSSDMLSKTMAVNTARGETCLVSSWPFIGLTESPRFNVVTPFLHLIPSP